MPRLAAQGAARLLHPPARSPQESPADFGVQQAELVSFPSADLTLTAWFLPPQPEKGGAALIFVHGFNGNRASLLAQAVAVHAAGYGALLLDLRGHGDSEGAMVTWGYNEAADVVAAYDYLVSRPEVDPQHIGLVGKSMGGAAVTRAAVQLPNLAAIVLESTYSGLEENFPSILTRIAKTPSFLSGMTLRLMERESGLPLREVLPRADLAVNKAPVLVVHGERDVIVSIEQGQTLFAAAQQPKQLYLIPNAGHLDIFTVDPDAFTTQLLAFLDAHLQEGTE
jgi:pimeloyl-ACP methyl ester carboxylesterase